jgi:hypothetical protein
LLFRLCRSLSPFMYSFVHRDHTASLHFDKCLARFLSSTPSTSLVSSSGSRLGCINSIEFGVRVGNWTSSSTSWAYGKEKIRGAERNLPDFSDCARPLPKKFFSEQINFVDLAPPPVAKKFSVSVPF